MLTENERGAAGGAALLRVGVGEERAFFGDAVNVGRLIAHDAVVVSADVVNADVIAPKDDDIRFLAAFLQIGGHFYVVRLERFALCRTGACC